jgi:hypothetical protein
LSDFALVIDTTNTAAKCPEEVTLQITLTVSGGTSLTPLQQVDLTLQLANLLGVSPARLTVVFQTSGAAAKRQTTDLSFSVRIAPPTNSSEPQQSAADAVTSFIERVQVDDTLLKSAVQNAVPGMEVATVSAQPLPLPNSQAAQTGVEVPVPPAVATPSTGPVSTPVLDGARPPRDTVSSSAVIGPSAILLFSVVYMLF